MFNHYMTSHFYIKPRNDLDTAGEKNMNSNYYLTDNTLTPVSQTRLKPGPRLKCKPELFQLKETCCAFVLSSRSLHTESEIFACVFSVFSCSPSIPIKMHAKMHGCENAENIFFDGQKFRRQRANAIDTT